MTSFKRRLIVWPSFIKLVYESTFNLSGNVATCIQVTDNLSKADTDPTEYVESFVRVGDLTVVERLNMGKTWFFPNMSMTECAKCVKAMDKLRWDGMTHYENSDNSDLTDALAKYALYKAEMNKNLGARYVLDKYNEAKES